MEERTESIHVRFHKDDYLEMAAYDYLKKNRDKVPYSKIIAEAIHHYLAGKVPAEVNTPIAAGITDSDIERIARAVTDRIRQSGMAGISFASPPGDTKAGQDTGSDASLISAAMLDFACGR